MDQERVSPATESTLTAAERAWARRFGSASRRELAASLRRALVAYPADAEERIQARIEALHCARYGAAALAAELADECARDAAVGDDAALVAYEAEWSRRLVRLQRRYPNRWCLPGLSEAELRDELTLRLIEALHHGPAEFSRDEHAGTEWGLTFLARQRRALRDAFRLRVELGEPSLEPARAPTEEERLIEAQSAATFALAREHAEQRLSRPQRRWLAALQVTAEAGEFFESSGQLNLAAVSRTLHRHRSSALRAFSELGRVFGQELKKLGG